MVACASRKILKPPVPEGAPGTPTLQDLEVIENKKNNEGERKNVTSGGFACRKRARAESSRACGSDFGKYKLKARIHIDQVPFSPGSEKRFGTLQIAFHGDAALRQPRLGVCLFSSQNQT